MATKESLWNAFIKVSKDGRGNLVLFNFAAGVPKKKRGGFVFGGELKWVGPDGYAWQLYPFVKPLDGEFFDAFVEKLSPTFVRAH